MRFLYVFMILACLLLSGCATTVTVVTSAPSGAIAYGYKHISRKKGEYTSGFLCIGKTPASFNGGYVTERAYVVWPDGTKSDIRHAKEDKMGLSKSQKKIHFVYPTLIEINPKKEYKEIDEEEFERIHWEYTQAKDTIPMYREFMKLFPNSLSFPQAQARLLELEDLAFQSVKLIKLRFSSNTDMIPFSIEKEIIDQIKSLNLGITSSDDEDSDATLTIEVNGRAKKEKYRVVHDDKNFITAHSELIELCPESSLYGYITLHVEKYNVSVSSEFSGKSTRYISFKYKSGRILEEHGFRENKQRSYDIRRKNNRDPEARLAELIRWCSRPDYLSACNSSNFRKSLTTVLSKIIESKR